MRILLTGESAAGHLSPIIAVYESIKKIMEEKSVSEPLEFLLISSESHFLQEMFEEIGIPYKVIKAPRRRQHFSLQKIVDIFRAIIGFFQSMVYVFDYMPDAVFSKGGYVSLPVIFWSWVFRIPVIIHESDAIASPLDKFMFCFAKKVAVSFENTKNVYDSPKIFFSGNPVRKFITEGDKKKGMEDFALNDEKPVVFVMGGSEGADVINSLILEILPELLAKYQIIHQCGIGNYDSVRSTVEKMNISNMNDYHLFPFFKKRIADAYAVCDLIISRAGANTVSEIMAVGKPSILIPLSTAVSDRQTKNAFYYSDAGAAVLVGEKNLKPHLLLDIVNGIFQNSLKIIEMQRAARQMAHPEAGKRIAEEIIKLAK
jgi:UDP-N-acetylglucosamine--N-acetylmuramyl-(pentapeptide) pyrophosphoryl-undecaprenol N-acetylglucosamine transferase